MNLLFAGSSFIAAFTMSSVLNWLALIPWRRAVGTHWTERARRLYPARVSALLNPWLFGVNAGVASQWFPSEGILQWLPAALAAWAGAALSNYFKDRQIWPGLSFRSWKREFGLYASFFQSGLLLVSVALAVMPPHFGWQTWLIAGVLLTILISLTLGLTQKILQWMHLIQPAPDHVRAIASCAAEKAGAKLRAVWVNEGPLANAFALLPMNDMLFSRRLLEVMSAEELDSICAHEAAHLTESKWIFLGRVLGVLPLYPLIFTVPVAHQFGLPGVLILFLMMFALTSLPRQLARRMEQRADAAAGQAGDPVVYARALEKLYQTNWMPAAMPKRSRLPHPDLYDRMVAAGITPTYERPRPPGKVSWVTYPLIVALAVQFTLIDPLSPDDLEEGNFEAASPQVEARDPLQEPDTNGNSITNRLMK
jgi:Zn-dependent protease with chaperone function